MASSELAIQQSAPNVTCQIVALDRRQGSCVLTAQPLKGDAFLVHLAVRPDPVGLDRITSPGSRVLATQLSRSGERLRAFVFVTAAGGARRVEVLPSAALALCERGVHGTWVEPRSDIPGTTEVGRARVV